MTTITNRLNRRPMKDAPRYDEVILGMMLEAPAYYRKNADFIREEWFCDDIRPFYKAARTLILNDITPVWTALRSQGITDADNPTYLRLLDSVASYPNFEYYTRLCAEQWMARTMLEACEVAKEALQRGKSGLDVFSIAEEYLRRIRATLRGKNEVSVADVLTGIIREVELSQQNAQNGEASGVPTHLPELDRITGGWRGGELTIIAARPSMGKTQFAIHCAVSSGVPVYFASVEMPHNQLIKRMLSMYSGVGIDRIITGSLTDEELQHVNRASANLFDDTRRADITIDDTAGLHIDDLAARVENWVGAKKRGLVIVDYLQILKGVRNKGDNREQEVSSISSGLKGIAKRTNLPVLALSQLSRAVEQRGGNKAPILSDLRESGSIEQDADVVIFPYRPYYHGIERFEDGSSTIDRIEFIVAKQRNGPTASVREDFRLSSGRFGEWRGMPEFTRSYAPMPGRRNPYLEDADREEPMQKPITEEEDYPF